MSVRWLIVASRLACSSGEAAVAELGQAAITYTLHQLQNHPCYPTKIVKMPTNNRMCENMNRSLCSVRYKLGFTPEIHSTIGLYGCVDLEKCESMEEFNFMLDRFCEVPSCSIFAAEDDNRVDGDRLLCITTQTLLCDSANRFSPIVDRADHVAMVCQDEDNPNGDTSNSDRDRAVETRRLLADNVRDLPMLNFDKEAGTQKGEEREGDGRTLKDDVMMLGTQLMAGLVDCGMGYYRDMPSLLFSGTTTSLGSYSSCLSHHNRDEFQYCTVQFDSMLYQGECLPKGCTPHTFYNLLNFICGEVGKRDGDPAYTGMETCVDFLDSIPPMLCLSAQMLGCGNTMTAVSNQQDILSVITTPRALPNNRRQHHRSAHRSHYRHSANHDLANHDLANHGLANNGNTTRNARGNDSESKRLSAIGDIFVGGGYDWPNRMPGMPLHLFQNFARKVQKIIENDRDLQSLFPVRTPMARNLIGGSPFGESSFGDNLLGSLGTGLLGGDGGRMLSSDVRLYDDSGNGDGTGMNKTGDRTSWWSRGEDTIRLHRYESPAGLRYRVRCGGWTAVLDDSRFNKAVGVLVVLVAVLLPLYPTNRRLIRGWVGNISSNIQDCSSRAKFLGRGDFSHVCGLRSLNMFWVVLGHTFTFSWQEGVDQNLKEALGLVHDYKFQFIISGQLAVDSFFFLSGLMYGLFGSSKLEAVYASTRDSSSRGGSTGMRATRVAKYAGLLMIKRYLRLVPTMSLVLAFSYFVLPYLGSGPMWVPYVDYLRYGMTPDRSGGCYKYWWNVLTLTNNLSRGAEGLQCLGHTWYLSNDFQFYILGNALVILSCLTSRKVMYSAAAGVLAVASIYSYHVVRTEHLHFSIPAFSDSSITPAQEGGTMELMQNWATFYVKPWCRIGPYLVGLAAGICQRDGWFEKQITLLKPCATSGAGNSAGSNSNDTRRIDEDEAADETHQELAPDESPILDHDHCPSPEHVTSPTRRLLLGRLNRNYRQLDTMDAAPEYTPVADPYIVSLYTALSLIGAWACCVSVPYLANKGKTLTWNVTLDQLWFVYNRTLWALCLAWFSLVLVYVRTSTKDIVVKNPILVVLKEILANRPMALCSVYTFTFYLVHPLVEQAYYATRTTDVCLNNLIGWFATISHFCFTAFFGVLTTAMIEFPLGKIFTAIGL
ncbi:putative transmembrane protein [Gregarina niphandrodes]|uniref:Transmembrane protein n=1 Tax=Gregarina niphandrodes TaxID=110365 RepID=A0A023B6I8_GRENI|nr:putative transmembrane protein [Gregarina niphandrodes]EZG66558.1 putative transmembrane protein [Gregarina niphandrodes]|eukprot:XP_011130611.1 putative transmembrane protein [Gregarina niphandrodes]